MSAMSTLRSYAALGDSYTAGLSCDERRWPDDLAAALGQARPGVAYDNLAEAGATSRRVAETQIDRALALAPGLVTLVCGGNDVLLSLRPRVADYVDALSGMLARLERELPGCLVLTATTPDPSPFMGLRPRTRARLADAMAELNAATRRTAREHGIVCVELAGDGCARLRESFASDGLHASRTGHARTAELVAQAIQAHPRRTRVAALA